MAKKTKNNNFYKILSFSLIVITVILTMLLVYFNVLPTNYLVIILVFMYFIILFVVYKLNVKTKNNIKVISTIVSIIIILLELVGIIYASGTIKFFSNILDNNYVYETYGLYVPSNSDIKKIKDLNNKCVVFYTNNDESKEIALSKLNSKVKVNVEKMNNKTNAILKVKDNECNAIYINESLMDIYLEESEDDFKLINSFEVKIKSDNEFELVDITKKPFVIYLSGVDTRGNVNNSARSDVNLLAVVNPKTGKILLVNTPRDYYIKLASKNEMDKLTHAGIYGPVESAKSLGLLYDVDINYYARVNFSSFIKVIDALGGVKVNVQKPDYKYNNGIDCLNYVCEQNSKREFGDKIIYIKTGVNVLDGEKALAYIRNRYQYSDGDNARVRHQLEVINAIIDKVLSKTILTKYNSLISSLSSGIKTNLDQKMITKMINYQIDKNIKWSIDSITVSGTDGYKPVYSVGNLNSYVMIPNEEDILKVKDAIRKTIEN